VLQVYPYINVYYANSGLSMAQIGFLALLKPWLNAPLAAVWAGCADVFAAHRAIFITTLIASTLVGCSTAFFHSFPAFVVLAVVYTVLGSPVVVLADSAVVQQCKEASDDPPPDAAAAARCPALRCWLLRSALVAAALRTLALRHRRGVREGVVAAPGIHRTHLHHISFPAASRHPVHTSSR
jgi:hypothetical protein